MKLKNREIDGVIFDVDGTLLDSMAIWEDAGARYLRSAGIEPAPDLGKILFPMSLDDGVAYVKREYHLEESEAELREAVLKQVEIFYKEEAPLKKGVRKPVSYTHLEQSGHIIFSKYHHLLMHILRK